MAQALIEKKNGDTNTVNELEISSEFLEDNRKFSQTTKRGGRDNKMSREKRRKEVFRLCFEFGYPVITVAKILHKNRHTIESDVKYLCSQINALGLDIYDLFTKQVYRMEIQRSRLVEKLHKEADFEKQMKLEKMISKIDNDIINLDFRLFATNTNISDLMTKKVNEILEYHNVDKKYFSSHDLIDAPSKTYEKVRDIMNEKSEIIVKW